MLHTFSFACFLKPEKLRLILCTLSLSDITIFAVTCSETENYVILNDSQVFDLIQLNTLLARVTDHLLEVNSVVNMHIWCDYECFHAKVHVPFTDKT